MCDNLQLTLSERNEFFDSIFDLVDRLTQMHPGYFSQAEADDVMDELQNVSGNPCRNQCIKFISKLNQNCIKTVFDTVLIQF